MVDEAIVVAQEDAVPRVRVVPADDRALRVRLLDDAVHVLPRLVGERQPREIAHRRVSLDRGDALRRLALTAVGSNQEAAHLDVR